MNNNNPLTNQSYINKDFQTIYPELLDLVKTLTYKWDPTVSNESDPGVLLIKLNAIIADKNNYNIDKNVLECFPDTVTQTHNAHKLFEQLGYNMHWYRAAKGELTFNWKSEKVESDLFDGTLGLKVPQFTMVCDQDKELVFTITEEFTLYTDGKNATVTGLQGVIRDFMIGNSLLIKPSMLDYRNRLHFPVFNVAQNGIFISDANKNRSTGEYEFIWKDPNSTTIDGWVPVENLHIQEPNTKCYKFGIDQTTNSCYIEFPSDVVNLMGEGIFVKYIQTDGASGNIAPKRINMFYEDVEIKVGEGKVNLTTDATVNNYSAINNGEDPETIDDAYVNYKKVVGTFDTLVTLRDYLNYIVNDEFEIVSNGVVADRGNDIQSSYSVVTTEEDVTTFTKIVPNIRKIVESVPGETLVVDSNGNPVSIPAGSIVNFNTGIPEMSAFDLKTYFLEYSPWPKFSIASEYDSQKQKFKEAYDKSFKLKLGSARTPLDTSDDIKNYYTDSQRIEHDFIPKLPNRPLFFKNKFKLNLTIIPNNTVSQTQAEEIERNVYDSVLKQLSSKNISFGEELSFERVYDICQNADERIKAIALDSIEYTPYAVIYITDPDEWTAVDVDGVTPLKLQRGLNEIPVSQTITTDKNTSITTLNDQIALEICAKNVLSGTTPLYHKVTEFSYDLANQNGQLLTDAETMSSEWTAEFNNVSENWVSMRDYTGARHNEAKQVLDNESIVFFAPYLEDVMTYATSIKYVYYTTPSYTGSDEEFIPGNMDYILERGQNLFMFWKDEDSKDAPYLYKKYGEGTILRATSNLVKSTDENYESIWTTLETRGYEGEGQILGQLNEDLYHIGDTLLSTNKTVVIKKVNAAALTDKHNYCYWFTNDVTSIGQDDYYRLTLKYIPPIPEEVMDSYSSGLIYVSNFTSGPPIPGNTPNDIDLKCTLNAFSNSDDEIIRKSIRKCLCDSGSRFWITDFNYDIKKTNSNGVITQVVLSDIQWDTSKIMLHNNSGGDTAETIYVLKPQQKTITYRKKTEGSEQIVSDQLQVTNYICTQILKPGTDNPTVVSCTGDIIKAPDEILNDKNFKNLKVNDKLNWGQLTHSMETSMVLNRFNEIVAPVGDSGIPNISQLDSDYAGHKFTLTRGTDSKWTLRNTDTGDEWTGITHSDSSGMSEFMYKGEKSDITILTASPGQSTYKSGDTFKFTMGPTEIQYGAEFYRITTITADDYDIPQYNAAAQLLDTSDYLKLESGYRIDHINPYPEVDTTISHFEYVLRENEEFIYTDSEKKGLYIQSAGTKVMMDWVTSDLLLKLGQPLDSSIPETITYTVMALDSKEVHDESGSELYKDLWYDFTCDCETDSNNKVLEHTSGTVVSVLENQIITLGSGSEIRLNLIPQIVQRRRQEGGSNVEGEIYTETIYDPAFKHLRIDKDGVKVSGSESIPKKDSEFRTTPNILSHYSIQYRDPKDQTWQTLPSAAHPSIGWDGYTRLDLKSGANKPQKVSPIHNAKIVFTARDGYTPSELVLPVAGSKVDWYFQTSQTVSMFGGENVNVVGTNAKGEDVYLSVYGYTLNTNITQTTDSYKVSKDDNNYLVEIKASPTNTTSIEFNCGFNTGTRFILPVEVLNSKDGIRMLEIQISQGTDGNLVSINPIGYKETNIGGISKMAVYYDVSGLTRLKINYKGTKDIALWLRPLFPYTYNYSKTSDIEKDKKVTLEHLCCKLMDYDIYRQFDYTYQPTRDTNIDNPLSPKSYFNKSHFCNGFTIPQISELEITTMNVRGI